MLNEEIDKNNLIDFHDGKPAGRLFFFGPLNKISTKKPFIAFIYYNWNLFIEENLNKS
jgi:hypothetical protein